MHPQNRSEAIGIDCRVSKPQELEQVLCFAADGGRFVCLVSVFKEICQISKPRGNLRNMDVGSLTSKPAANRKRFAVQLLCFTHSLGVVVDIRQIVQRCREIGKMSEW